MVPAKKQLLNFFDRIDKIAGMIGNKQLFIFLDYDGTCTPIVNTPQGAVLSDEMQMTLQELARQLKIGIVSGRTVEDVRSRVSIDNIFYAGSHGFEIVDPKGNLVLNKDATRIRHTVDEVHQRLENRLKNVPGAFIEHVKFTISAHYRLVLDSDFMMVKEAVDDILKDYKYLRKTTGKKVFEIRPKINWDKGKAVNFMLKLLGFDQKKDIAVYIGDNISDEVVFNVLDGKGINILVARELQRPTRANYIVKDPEEVKKVLEFFINLNKFKDYEYVETNLHGV